MRHMPIPFLFVFSQKHYVILYRRFQYAIAIRKVVLYVKNSTQYRIIEICELLCGSVLPIVFWVSMIFGFDLTYIAVLTLTAAAIHELGHYTAIFIFSKKGDDLYVKPSGFRIKRSESLSYKKEILILLFGPFANILFFILSIISTRFFGDYIRTFGYINLATGISNLLPLEGYDGYGALKELFASHYRGDLISRLEILSFIFSIFLTFISLYLIDRLGEGYWIFGIFFCAMLSKLASFGKYDIFGE